jgi:Arm DNA-binding domain
LGAFWWHLVGGVGALSVLQKLTDREVRLAKAGPKPRKLADGGGLHLLVTPEGGKLWRLKYRHSGKEKQLALAACRT